MTFPNKNLGSALLLHAAVLLLSGPALGQNETPTTDSARMFEPFRFQLGTGVVDACDSALADQHYTRVRIASTAPGTATTPPAVTVPSVWAAMKAGHGVFTVDTHGSTSGFAIEAYEYTSAGMAARDAAYAIYQSNPVYTGKLGTTAVPNVSYVIAVRGSALGAWFTDRKSIVFNSSCEGNAYAAKWGARVVLDYGGCIGSAAAVADAVWFWESMDGKKGVNNRPASAAKPAGMKLSGNGDTTLSPVVKNRAPDVPGLVEFDTTMDTSVAPNTVVTATGATLSNHAWANNHTVTFDAAFVSPWRKYTVHATAARSANNQIQLDGNLCETGPNGVGPNQDNYCWSVGLPPYFRFAGPFDVETPPFDNRCLGVEAMDGFLWVTGRGHATTGDNYQIHQYDMSGVYIQSFPQVTNSTGWAGRDMTSDGNTLYVGSDNAEVSEYLWSGGVLSHIGLRTISGVAGTVRAFCQKPGGNFFTKSFTSTFYEFNFASGMVNSVSQPALSAYGFGWDDVSGSIWSTTTGPSVQEVDTSCNFLSGMFGNTWGTSQGGADVYSDSRNPGFLSMVVLGQGSPDSVEMYNLGASSGGGGLNLSVANLVAGAMATISVSGATPGGLVRHGYSLAGGGPTSTPFGDLLLTPPYQEFPVMTADASGNASMMLTIPAGSTGVMIWIHAIDLGSAIFTNGLNQVIG